MPDPAGIAITGRPYENLGMDVPKIECLRIGLGGGRHGISVDEKRGLLKWIEVYNGRAEIENRIKEGKNTLRWDKTSRQRFEANQARLKMEVLAYNLLHMIRQFFVWGEEVKRSMEWLIKRLIKVGARVSYHARKWYVQNWGDSPAGGCMIKG